MEIKPLNIFLKRIRLDNNNERLSDMAKRLGVSVSYLSSVETEKRRMTDKLYERIIKEYNLNEEQINELKEIRNTLTKQLNISLDEMNENKKNTVIEFLSNVEELSEEDLLKINRIVKKKK